jgi:hypothetical protein
MATVRSFESLFRQVLRSHKKFPKKFSYPDGSFTASQNLNSLNCGFDILRTARLGGVTVNERLIRINKDSPLSRNFGKAALFLEHSGYQWEKSAGPETRLT